MAEALIAVMRKIEKESDDDNEEDRITSDHLKRRAIVSLRQSSEDQVLQTPLPSSILLVIIRGYTREKMKHRLHITILLLAYMPGGCSSDFNKPTVDSGAHERALELGSSDTLTSDAQLLDTTHPGDRSFDLAAADISVDTGSADTASLDTASADTASVDSTLPDMSSADLPSCHKCPLPNATQCSAGKLKTCKLNSKGCRAWVESRCQYGFCTKDKCGVCKLNCNPSTSGCLWQADSCGEIIWSGGPISNLAANTEGLFWNRAAKKSNSALMLLQAGKQMPVELKSTANLSMKILAYSTMAFAQTSGSHSQLLVKEQGTILKPVDAWKTGGLAYANHTHGYFAKSVYSGASTSLYYNTIPSTCQAGNWCWIGSSTIFYSGSSEWPASTVAAADSSYLFFRSNRYGNYPATDIKRDSWRIYKKPLKGGSLTQVTEGYGWFGPSAMARDSDYLYYMLNMISSKLRRVQVNTGKEETIYSASKSTAPLISRFVVENGVVFWLDYSGNLKRLRPGEKTPEQLMSKLNYRNIALTKEAVYVTDSSQTKLIRWRR